MSHFLLSFIDEVLLAAFDWLFLLLDAGQLFTISPLNGVQSADPRY